MRQLIFKRIEMQPKSIATGTRALNHRNEEFRNCVTTIHRELDLSVKLCQHVQNVTKNSFRGTSNQPKLVDLKSTVRLPKVQLERRRAS